MNTVNKWSRIIARPIVTGAATAGLLKLGSRWVPAAGHPAAMVGGAVVVAGTTEAAAWYFTSEDEVEVALKAAVDAYNKASEEEKDQIISALAEVFGPEVAEKLKAAA